jgi:drug/metabolite transporter (DMT)-like permease
VWVIVLGTLAPYALDLAALRHLPVTTVGAVGMLEPVVAAGVAWLWLEQALTTTQVAGGLVVLAGVALAQAARNTVDDAVPVAGPHG